MLRQPRQHRREPWVGPDSVQVRVGLQRRPVLPPGVDQLADALDRPAPATTAELPECCTAPYDESLFHGPAFHTIKQVLRYDAKGIVARLATSGALGWPDGWQIDPVALDGALQLLRVWGWAEDGRPSLPTSIARCRAWTAWPANGEVICHLTAKRENAFRLRGDALFTDPASGRVLASLEGIVMHVQG